MVRSPTEQDWQGVAQHTTVTIRTAGPFDLRLSLAAAASFFPVARAPPLLAAAVELDGTPVLVRVWQPNRRTSLVCASSAPEVDKGSLAHITKWLVSSDLALKPFCQLVGDHPVVGPVATFLDGLKPFRPPSLFEMAIIAITEQQLSLAAAFHIRTRLVQRFGMRLADRVSQGALDFDALKHKSDADIRNVLLATRGFGDWSVEYILARGFGRQDALPSGDVGLRRVVGHYLGEGRRLTPIRFEQMLAPF